MLACPGCGESAFIDIRSGAPARGGGTWDAQCNGCAAEWSFSDVAADV